MKKLCITLQSILLAWFMLDMTGFSVGNKVLVSCSYKEDDIFFLIYLVAFLFFIFKDKIGKWIVAIWTSCWFVIQFMSHEWYTIFNSGLMGSLQNKIKYFSNTIQWVQLEGKYIPDVYHTILHVLILSVMVTTFIFIKKARSKKEK